MGKKMMLKLQNIVVKYGEIKNILEENLILQIADRAQYYSSGFKKRDAKYKSVVNINLKEFLLKIL